MSDNSANGTGAAPKWQQWLGRVMSGLVVALMGFSASFKLVQPGDFAAGWSVNYPIATARPIGTAEILCALLYAIPRTRVLGAILLVGYLGGATATHVRLGQPVFVFPVLVGVVAWLALWLRDPRLRAFAPLTKDG